MLGCALALIDGTQPFDDVPEVQYAVGTLAPHVMIVTSQRASTPMSAPALSVMVMVQTPLGSPPSNAVVKSLSGLSGVTTPSKANAYVETELTAAGSHTVPLNTSLY